MPRGAEGCLVVALLCGCSSAFGGHLQNVAGHAHGCPGPRDLAEGRNQSWGPGEQSWPSPGPESQEGDRNPSALLSDGQVLGVVVVLGLGPTVLGKAQAPAGLVMGLREPFCCAHPAV